MVERPRLWFGPWRSADAARLIVDGGAVVGQARPSRHGGRSWWRFWCAPAGIDVCETDDLALVMTIAPSRLASDVWVVRDCDGNLVGKLRGDDLLDPWSQPFARRVLVADNVWQMRELDGRIYATWTAADDGDMLAFADRQLTNPFVRMLVIASFLLVRPIPNAIANRSR